MSTAFVSVCLLSAYMVILAALAFKSYRTQSHNGYVIGGRNLGLFTTTCSMLAGQFNGGGVFFTFTFGMMVGYGLLWFAFGFLLGYVLLSFFVQTVNKESRAYGDVNVPDILKRRIGQHTEHFGSFLIIGKACLFGTAQLLIAGTIIAALLGISSIWGIYITAFVIALYVSLGGYLTVVRTDILQWSILFILAILTTLWLPTPEFSEIIYDVSETDTKTKWGFLLFTFMLIISNADVWQRMMSVRTTKMGQKALLSSGFFFVVFILAMVIILKSWNMEAGISFFTLFEKGLLSSLTLAFLGTFTLVAVMSTIDTQVQLFSSALSKNVLKIDLDQDKNRFVWVSKVATITLLGGIALVASTMGSTLEFVLKAFSFAYILAPIMITAMIWGRQGTAYKDGVCVSALTLGLLLYAYMFFNGYFSVMINNVIPASLTAVICLAGIAVKQLVECLYPKTQTSR